MFTKKKVFFYLINFKNILFPKIKIKFILFIKKNTASMNESSKSYLKNESFAKTLSNNVKKLLSKENFKSHTKTFSMEIRNDKSKSPIPSIKSVNNIKDVLLGSSNITNSNSNQNLLSNLIKTSQNNNANLIQHNSNYKTTRSTYNNTTNNKNNNLVSNSNLKQANNNNNPLVHDSNGNFNLNSYTSNGNVKSEINLRGYIMNRVNVSNNNSNAKPGTSQGKSGNNTGGKSAAAPGHFRSNSNNIFG